MAIKRGFKNAIEHDEHIIEKWNSVVHKKDTVYILGDVTMETSKWYFRLDQLNGKKIVLLGNHDMPKDVEELMKYVDKVSGMMRKSFKAQGIVSFLTHCPIHPRELDFRVGINIHGHIHEDVIMKAEDNWGAITMVPDKRYICVSCEQVDYTPRSIEELIKTE